MNGSESSKPGASCASLLAWVGLQCATTPRTTHSHADVPSLNGWVSQCVNKAVCSQTRSEAGVYGIHAVIPATRASLTVAHYKTTCSTAKQRKAEIPYVYIWWTVRVGRAQRECVTVAALSLLSETGHSVAGLCGLLSAHCPLSDCCGRRHCIVGCHACQMDWHGPVFSKTRTVKPTVVTEK